MTLKEQGFFHPAEWHEHDATWLSWPHNIDTWKKEELLKVWEAYAQFVRYISWSEQVNINIGDELLVKVAQEYLQSAGANMKNIKFFPHKTNDAWCRDHGPDFLIHTSRPEKMILNWGYNAWGGKYPPFDDDDRIPEKVANAISLPYHTPGIILEGGSVEFNGEGTVLTTKSCLLNKNRNPHLHQDQIEKLLIDNFGVEQVIWLEEGIEGDDTDGHIDDITRFVNKDTVVTVLPESKHPNYKVLEKNLKILEKQRLVNGRSLNIITLPEPEVILYHGDALPASYANYCVTNKAIIVPVFGDKNDDEALDILASCFPDREVVGIDSRDIIIGLGSFHCLSKQEPKVIGN